MPQVPAICNTCSRMFPSGVEMTNSRNVTFINTTSRCPFCGSVGSIPDGVYEATETTISAVLSGAKSLEALNRLSTTLQALRSSPTTQEEVAEKIKRDAPEFASLADVAQGLRGFTLQGWIMTVLMLIAIIVPHLDALNAEQSTHQDLERIYNELLRQGPAIHAPAAAPVPSASATQPAPNVVPKVGRNEPCPCGSGKKYKRCHGA